MRWTNIAVRGFMVAAALHVAGVAAAQDWGFSADSGAVVRVNRDSSLNLTGTLSLPTNADGKRETVPLSGRNEAGRLILRYNDPSTGQAREVIYRRKTSADGGYTVWVADDAPDEISELRAPINVSDRPAQTVLDNWQGTTDALLPVAIWTDLIEAHAKTSKGKSVAAERVLREAGRESAVAIVADRPSAAAWQAAANNQRVTTSTKTFSGKKSRSAKSGSGKSAGAGRPMGAKKVKSGVVMTMSGADFISVVQKDGALLEQLGGVSSQTQSLDVTRVVVTANPNVHRFGVPLDNIFDAYAESNYDLKRISDGLDKLMAGLKQRKLDCSYGEAATASFTISCQHHCSAYGLRGNYLLSTIFTFAVGERRQKIRQVFIMADSWAANVKVDAPTPGRDKFSYSRQDEKPIDEAHGIAVANLGDALASMYRGLLRY
jgi:hypothetical protein